MAAGVVLKQETMNCCCEALRVKCAKLNEQRKALRQGVNICEQQIEKSEAENRNLKKVVEEERLRADIATEEKAKELVIRHSLEDEISTLKSEVLSLQQKVGSQTQDLSKDAILQMQIAERETEINQLKELIEKERSKAESEKKKAELEKKKAEAEKKKSEAEKKKASEAWKIVEEEKSMVDELRKLANMESKTAEENKLQLETLKREVDEMKSKLAKANQKLEVEKKMTIKEKNRADLELAKAEEQRKLAEMHKKKEIEERCRANCLSKQLEDHGQKIEKLQKKIDELVSSRKLVEAAVSLPNCLMNDDTAKARTERNSDLLKQKCDESRRIEEEDLNVVRQKECTVPERRKAEEQITFAEVNKKDLNRKNSTGQFARLLGDNKQMTEELQEEILQFLSSKALIKALFSPPGRNMNAEAAKKKLLKKQLKFEKMRVKHAKKVAKLGTIRDNILRQELNHLKQDFVQFARRIDMLDNCFLHSDEGVRDLAKIGNRSTQSLNTKEELFDTGSYQRQLCGENELVKPSCTAIVASGQTTECSPSLPVISGRNFAESTSGIDSKLEPLIRGSTRKILQSSALNSTTASFSDRPLVGSQGRGVFSVATSAKCPEEKSNPQPTTSWISGEVTKARYNENPAVVAENSVGSHVTVDSVAGRARNGKKRKRILDAVGSLEHANSEVEKGHLEKKEKLSMFNDILNSQMDKPWEEGRCLVSSLQDNLYTKQDKPHKKRKTFSKKKVAAKNLPAFDEKKDDTENFNVCFPASLPSNKLIGTGQTCKDSRIDYDRSNQEIAGSFEDVENGDYMKLLDLDNAVDEECYRVAIEIPLSPSLPEIEFQSFETYAGDKSACLVDGSSCEVPPGEKANLVPFSLNVINMEADSNKLKLDTCGSSHASLLHKSEGFVNSYGNLENKENEMHNTINAGNASGSRNWDSGVGFTMSDASISGVEMPRTLNEGDLRTLCDDLPKFCVVFSDTRDSCSISRIFCGIKTCMAECFMLSQSDCVVQKILPALLKVDYLLPKERVCVLFSLLLNNISGITLENLGNFLKNDSACFLDSFGSQISAVISGAETRRMFAELCHLEELLTLIEDFLIDRRILVYNDVYSGSSVACDSKVDILLNGDNITLFFEMASTHQLVAGGVVLASVCAAFGQIGFVCEASYNISRMHKFNSSLVLTILHVFAYQCGSTYFTLNHYSLLMAVLKSLVTVLERGALLTDSPYRGSSSSWPEFSSCSKCPFSEGAVSVDTVILMLLEKLQNHAFSNSIIHQVPIESVNSLNSGTLSHMERLGPSSGHEDAPCILCSSCNSDCCLDNSGIPTVQSDSMSDGTLCHFNDILSLIELVACNMSWDWTCNKILSPLLKMLESCVLEKFSAAIVILLGQLGRLGIDANGYEDIEVGNLRCKLSVFLCQCISRKLGLSIQIATVSAFVGLLPLGFEELIKSNVELPTVVSKFIPADYIREWFSLLSNEQKLLSLSLLQSSGMWNYRSG